MTHFSCQVSSKLVSVLTESNLMPNYLLYFLYTMQTHTGRKEECGHLIQHMWPLNRLLLQLQVRLTVEVNSHAYQHA